MSELPKWYFNCYVPHVKSLSFIRVGLPWEVLYVDDLVVVIADSEEVIRKLNVWRRGLEKKGLTVNLS